MPVMKAPDYASSFEKYRSQTTETTLALLDYVLHYVPSYPAARVIDIGCGTVDTLYCWLQRPRHRLLRLTCHVQW